jgi:hypothetical protein
MLSVRSAGPADVAFTGTAAGGRAEIEMTTADGVRRAEVVANRDRALSFAAVPDASELLFTVSSRRGRAILDGFLIIARDAGQAGVLQDATR